MIAFGLICSAVGLAAFCLDSASGGSDSLRGHGSLFLAIAVTATALAVTAGVLAGQVPQ